MFDLVMKIMQSGRFNAYPAAMETLLSSAISFASNAKAHLLLYKWYITGEVTNSMGGKAIEGTEINVKVRHTMVRKFFASSHIEPEAKQSTFRMLAELDESDMLGRTQKYCEAANPEANYKQKALLTIFENCNDMSLQHV